MQKTGPFIQFCHDTKKKRKNPMLRLNDFKIFCICLPHCDAGASIQKELNGKDAALGTLFEHPPVSCWYPTGNSIPSTAPAQPQPFWGELLEI